MTHGWIWVFLQPNLKSAIFFCKWWTTITLYFHDFCNIFPWSVKKKLYFFCNKFVKLTILPKSNYQSSHFLQTTDILILCDFTKKEKIPQSPTQIKKYSWKNPMLVKDIKITKSHTLFQILSLSSILDRSLS